MPKNTFIYFFSAGTAIRAIFFGTSKVVHSVTQILCCLDANLQMRGKALEVLMKIGPCNQDGSKPPNYAL